MDTADKLHALRDSISKQSVAGYIQPVHDEYLSEYPPACFRRVEWLSGFSGSAGSVVVLSEKAALFVDGRYTLQAKNEVDGQLFEQHNIADTLPEAWLAEHAKSGERIGYDPKLYTSAMLGRMKKTLGKKNIELVPCINVVDAIWKDRPVAPNSPLFIHTLQHTGEESLAKRRRIAKKIREAGASVAILTAPDSICWLLNIRAHDVENTPLALCNAIIGTDAKVQFFIASTRCNADVVKHLGDQVTLCDPSTLEKALESLKDKNVLCDPQAVTVWFTNSLEKAGATIIEGPDPCVLPKATKNPVELQGIRNAHIRDGVAVTKLLCWLDQRLGQQPITEIDVCAKLAQLRAAHPLFVEPSFPTISGSGPNGAIVHYRVSPESNRTLRKGELLLLDSGGQYPDGTTDITRTVALSEPTPEHKNRFTLVLKGHIAIATALFPEGTSGTQLDALARQYLWQAGLDYDHGTGHGVGHFLGVHEGPQRISKRSSDVALTPGMIVSNEPGYYKTGEYGIRIENLVAVVEKSKGENGKKILGFDTVTCVPLDARLVDAPMLTAKEKEWFNDYHAWVAAQLAEGLDESERAWLKARCQEV